MMKFAVCFVCLFSLAAAGSQSGSPVQKVIELLENLKGKVASDLAKEEAAMGEYMQYCDNESSEKQYAIKSAGKQIEGLLASIEDAEAEVASAESDISDLSSQIAKKESELAQAGKLRKSEHGEFKKNEGELIDANDELERAEVVVKKEMSAAFLQGKAKGKALLRMSPASARLVANALAKVVDAAWIGSAQAKTLKGFLQQQQGVDDEDKDLTMHAAMHKTQEPEDAEGGSGGGVLATLKDTENKAVDQLTEARKREMGAQHTFDMMKMSLEDGINLLKQRLSDATSQKALMQEQIGASKGEKAEAEKSKAADEEYLSSLTTNCKSTSQEWAKRQKDAAEEMGAIDKAKEILATGVTAMVQTGSPDDFQEDPDEESDADQRIREKVEQLLKDVGQKVHSFAMVEMASAVAQDPFAKVRGLIEDMVAKLMESAAEEADHKAFCDEELGKSRKAKDAKASKLDQYRARIEQAASGKDELGEAIKELQEEVAEIDASQQKATEQRNEEHSNYLTASKDFKASAEAVEKAMAVLSEYYGKSFVQKKVVQSTAAGSRKQPSFGGGSSSDVASTILSILEVSASDFTRLLAECEADEEKQGAAYKKLSDENRLSKTAKLAEVRGKESEVKSLKVALAHHNEDYKVVDKEYAAVVEYLDKLKPECETKAMSYEEKKQRREQEIEGLKEALAIIEGRSVPTSLTQVRKH